MLLQQFIFVIFVFDLYQLIYSKYQADYNSNII